MQHKYFFVGLRSGVQECAFYGLESLAEKIRGWTCPLDLLLSDRNLRERERSARDDPGGAHKATLIDVHAAVTTPLSRESLELPLLRQEVPPPALEGSFEDFWTRLNNFSGGLIEELADVPGLIVAGGAIIGALTKCPAGDIDIFLHPRRPSRAHSKKDLRSSAAESIEDCYQEALDGDAH